MAGALRVQHTYFGKRALSMRGLCRRGLAAADSTRRRSAFHAGSSSHGDPVVSDVWTRTRRMWNDSEMEKIGSFQIPSDNAVTLRK